MKNNTKIDNNLKKILIIGGNGFLGRELLSFRNDKKSTQENYSLIAADLHNRHMEQTIPFHIMDITNVQKTMEKISKIRPNIIILTAAMTNVDQCEINKKLATKINLDGTINVLNACKKINSKLIFISTDFIFDGAKENGNYNENDVPNPLNHYAKTKNDAELFIMNSNIEYLICRASVLYGWNKWKLNFITWILENLKHEQKMSIVKNQINSPTYVKSLAQIIFKLIEKDAKGIYHTAGDCALSRYQIALKCAEIFEYNNSLITPIDSIKQKALRPANVSLNINKLKSLIGSELKSFTLADGLIDMKEHNA